MEVAGGRGEEGRGGGWGGREGGREEGREGGRGGELTLKSRFDFKSLFRPLGN